MQEVKWFLALLIIVGWGFACSFYILFRQNQKAEVRLGHLWSAAVTCMCPLRIQASQSPAESHLWQDLQFGGFLPMPMQEYSTIGRAVVHKFQVSIQ